VSVISVSLTVSASATVTHSLLSGFKLKFIVMLGISTHIFAWNKYSYI
jgi:hypothetical protein